MVDLWRGTKVSRGVLFRELDGGLKRELIGR